MGKSLMLNFLRLIGTFLGFLLMMLIGGIIIPSSSSTKSLPESKKDRFIIITYDPVHTNIVLPKSFCTLDWEQFLSMSEKEKQASFLHFGWGEKQFYLNTPDWNTVSIRRIWIALFIPSPSVMHVGFSQFSPEESKQYQSYVVPLSSDQFYQIEQFIFHSFNSNHSNSVQKIGAYQTDYDAFYDANDYYHGFNTCNNWTSKALKTGGLKAPLWSPLSIGLLFYLSQD